MFSSFSFDGYRAFPSRRMFGEAVPMQRLELAPLTVLLGQNNAGKSSVLALLAQVQHALAARDGAGLPLTIHGRALAATALHLLPYRDRLNRLEVEAQIDGPRGTETLTMRLAPLGQVVEGDDRLWAQSLLWEGRSADGLPAPLTGTLPDALGLPPALRDWLRAAAEDSVWLGPLRLRPPESVPLDPRRAVGPVLQHDGLGAVEALRRDRELYAWVRRWFAEHVELRLRWDDGLRTTSLECSRSGVGWVGVEHAGSGIHQLLPVVCLAGLRKLGRAAPGRLDLIEQPELHLHDALHPVLADLLLDMAAGGGRVVVETHSEGLLLRLRRRIAEGAARPEVLRLCFVAGPDDSHRDGAYLRPISVNERGELGGWPEGVFLETFDELAALRRAQRSRARA
jgi:hypothetical protein